MVYFRDGCGWVRTEQGGWSIPCWGGEKNLCHAGGWLIEISVWICGYGSDGSQYNYSCYSNELMARGFMFRRFPR